MIETVTLRAQVYIWVPLTTITSIPAYLLIMTAAFSAFILVAPLFLVFGRQADSGRSSVALPSLRSVPRSARQFFLGSGARQNWILLWVRLVATSAFAAIIIAAAFSGQTSFASAGGLLVFGAIVLAASLSSIERLQNDQPFEIQSYWGGLGNSMGGGVCRRLGKICCGSQVLA